MSIHDSCIAFLKTVEGCCLTPYQDVAGVWTVGYGHTQGVSASTPAISQDNAEWLLRQDLLGCEKCLANSLRISCLTQNQYNALLSFVFNVGEGNFLNSTLLRVLNAGDLRGAANELDKWVFVTDPSTRAKVVSPGLKNRRAKEKALFLADLEAKRRSVG